MAKPKKKYETVMEVIEYIVKRDVSKPYVYCPRKRRRVPVWWCLGSLAQGKRRCPELVAVRVNYKEGEAKVRCGPREKEGLSGELWGGTHG